MPPFWKDGQDPYLLLLVIDRIQDPIIRDADAIDVLSPLQLPDASRSGVPRELQNLLADPILLPLGYFPRLFAG